MSKFPVLSGKEVINVLTKAGFEIISQKGSHVKLVKFASPKLIVIVPMKKVIQVGTFKSILRQAGMTLKKFSEFI